MGGAEFQTGLWAEQFPIRTGLPLWAEYLMNTVCWLLFVVAGAWCSPLDMDWALGWSKFVFLTWLLISWTLHYGQVFGVILTMTHCALEYSMSCQQTVVDLTAGHLSREEQLMCLPWHKAEWFGYIFRLVTNNFLNCCIELFSISSHHLQFLF